MVTRIAFSALRRSPAGSYRIVYHALCKPSRERLRRTLNQADAEASSRSLSSRISAPMLSATLAEDALIESRARWA